MKKLLLSCLLMTAVISVNAQASDDDNTDTKTTPATATVTKPAPAATVYSDNPFANLSLTVKESKAFIGNFGFLNVLKVVVTDMQGDEMFTRKVSAKSNAIDLSRLKKGKLYFVTVMSEVSDNRKTFTLNY